LAKSLSTDGDFGHIWTVPRPLVYRALDTLCADGLVGFHDAEPGAGGPPRRVTVITAKGKKALGEWLREPIRHIRDARSLLLLKMAIINELGLDRSPLVDAQLDTVDAIERGLEVKLAAACLESDRLVLSYRLEMARALRRFLARQAIAPSPQGS